MAKLTLVLFPAEIGFTRLDNDLGAIDHLQYLEILDGIDVFAFNSEGSFSTTDQEPGLHFPLALHLDPLPWHTMIV